MEKEQILTLVKSLFLIQESDWVKCFVGCGSFRIWTNPKSFSFNEVLFKLHKELSCDRASYHLLERVVECDSFTGLHG